MELIAIDIGASLTRVGLFDTTTETLVDKEVNKTPRLHDSQTILETITESIDNLVFRNRSVIGFISIGSAGWVDSNGGTIVNAPLFSNWNNLSISKILGDKYSSPVTVENDANLSALAELLSGAAQEAKNAFYFSISTGIGGAIIMNGRIYKGSKGFAGEFGHARVYPNGLLCGCGRQGCLEVYASGQAIASEAQRLVLCGAVTVLSSVYEDKKQVIETKDVFEAAKDGDSISNWIIDKASAALAITISNLNNSFNPDLFVFGGGVMRSGDLLMNKIQKQFSGAGDITTVNINHFKKSKFGDNSGLWGAYYNGKYALEKQNPFIQ